MNILIVDDEYGPRESLRMILKKQYNVYTADSGESALEMMDKIEFDLITLDIRMPGMSGIDLLKRIREQGRYMDVIIITGYGTYDYAVEGIRHGVMDFISKPFSVPEILHLVSSAHRRKKLREETDYEVLQQKIKELERQLSATHRRVKTGDLAALYAHEIKNPLGAISLRAQASLQELDDTNAPKIARHLESIVNQTQRISRITNGLLKLSHPGKSRKESIDVHLILEDMIDFFSIQLKVKRITIQKVFNRQIPQVWVDPDQVFQIFLNLALNAFKVLDEYGILLMKTCCEETTGNGRNSVVRIDFTDNGPGIPLELHEKIFEPFFTTDKESGSGIGLNACKNILNDMNGSIRVTSKPGEGATFSVYLPVAETAKSNLENELQNSINS